MTYLDQALAASERSAVVKCTGAVVAQEVEVELVIGELELLDKLHTKVLVELDYT